MKKLLLMLSGLVLGVLFSAAATYLLFDANRDTVFRYLFENSYEKMETLAYEDQLNNPLYYSIDSVWSSVEKSTDYFMGMFLDDSYAGEEPSQEMAKSFLNQSIECSGTKDQTYFENLVATFASANAMEYTFTYKGESQDSSEWTVTLLQNSGEYYKNLDDFKGDFNICSAGGDYYPTRMNSQWLMFESSCGSGFDDGSGKPKGCEELRKAIEPTLEFN